MPLTYDVAGLRDNCEPEMKERHLEMIVSGLTETLDEVLDSELERHEELDDYDKVDPSGYRFRVESQHWEDQVRQPVKWSK